MNISNLRRLLIYLQPYKSHVAFTLAALLISTGSGLCYPLLIVRLIDSVEHAKTQHAVNRLVLWVASMLIVQAVFSFFQTYFLTLIGENIVYDLRAEFYGHIQALSFDFYTSHRTGEIISRLGSDVTQVRTILTRSIASALRQTISLVGAVAIIFAINPRLALFVLCLAIALILSLNIFGKGLQGLSTTAQDRLASSTVVAEETLTGIQTVKSFGREMYEKRRYNAAAFKTFKIYKELAFRESLFTTIIMLLNAAFLAAITWWGGREVISGRLSIAMITGFLIYGILITENLAGLSALYGQFRVAIGGVQRLFEILDLRPSVQDAFGAIVLPSVSGEINFEDVSFGYRNGVLVIADLNLHVRAGEIVALVGPSGAGKSTLLKLLQRFYDPLQGKLTIDGYDLRELTQESLRAQIAAVPQDIVLFGSSIRDNIQYGRLDASPAEIVLAAKAANAHEFIMGLPDQYETNVGERGLSLSGGQRQCIAIARAVLRQPRILLLDEATSSLDSESEELVQDAIRRLMSQRTTLVIAHRLSTVKYADRIAVLRKGRLVELGSHRELIKQQGLYSRLYLTQFSAVDPSTE